jgi:class 3 adenylate cyclase/ATP/maltotriose-dependent transcriptional regulator MalT
MRRCRFHEIGEHPHQFEPSNKRAPLVGDAYLATWGIRGLEPKRNVHGRHHHPGTVGGTSVERRMSGSTPSTTVRLLRSERQRVVTALVTDVKGSTAFRTRLGDRAADRMFAPIDAAIDDAIHRHGGSLVKSMGDGVLACFDTPRAAVLCAVDIQRATIEQGAGVVEVRIGINTGEVTVADGDLAGEAVAAAARITALADGGEILVADVVRQLAGTMPGLVFSDRGRHRLKGFPDLMRVCEARSSVVPAGSVELPLVGRDVELALLREALQSVAAGMGRLVLVEGEAGIGKSRILRQAAETGAALGLPVFTGAAERLERDRPFRALVDALHIDVYGPDSAPDTPSPLERSDQTFVVIDRVVDELEQRCAVVPLVLLLEDLHWADPATLRTVQAIARRLAHLPMALVATFRTDASPDLHELIDVVRGVGGHHLRLAPLRTGDIADLVRAALSAEPDAALIELLSKAGGNPLYALELCSALVHDGAIETIDGTAHLRVATIPPELRLLILRFLSTLPATTVNLLKTGSVLGARFSVTQLATVLQQVPTDLLQDLEVALHAGVLAGDDDRLTFRHDLIREALYDEIPAAVRQALHRQVAERLIATGTAPELVAEHVVLGATLGDGDAVRWLRDAALTMQRRSAPAAASMFRQARELAIPGNPDYNEVTLALANALIRSGFPVEAAELARDALARGADEAIARRTLVTALIHHRGGPTDRVAECRRALAMPDLDLVERATLLSHLAFEVLLLGDLDEAITLSALAIAESERAGDVYSRTMAFQGMALTRHVRGELDEAMSLGQKAIDLASASVSERTGLNTPYLIHGISLLVADRLDDASATFTAGRQACERAGVVPWLAAFTGAIGLVHLLRGALDDADAEFNTAVETAETLVSPWTMVSVSLALLDYLALARGDAEAPTTDLDRGQVTIGIDLVFWARALRAEANGDVQQAADLAATAWSISAHLPHLFTRAFVAPDVVRLVRSSDHVAASSVVECMQEGALLAPSHPSIAAGALRCRGLLDDDPDTLVAAVGTYSRTERVLERALCVEEAGASLSRAGRSDEAIAHLGDALNAYEAMRLTRFATRTQATLRTLGVRRRRPATPTSTRIGWESLSPTEHEVVALVVEGLTNKGIGERLFISRRTVETHLAHVFVKLGVTNRAHVAAQAVARLGRT